MGNESLLEALRPKTMSRLKTFDNVKRFLSSDGATLEYVRRTGRQRLLEC